MGVVGLVMSCFHCSWILVEVSLAAGAVVVVTVEVSLVVGVVVVVVRAVVVVLVVVVDMEFSHL